MFFGFTAPTENRVQTAYSFYIYAAVNSWNQIKYTFFFLLRITQFHHLIQLVARGWYFFTHPCFIEWSAYPMYLAIIRSFANATIIKLEECWSNENLSHFLFLDSIHPCLRFMSSPLSSRSSKHPATLRVIFRNVSKNLLPWWYEEAWKKWTSTLQIRTFLWIYSPSTCVSAFWKPFISKPDSLLNRRDKSNWKKISTT